MSVLDILNEIREIAPKILTELQKSANYLKSCKNYLLHNGECKARVCFTTHNDVIITVSVFSITEHDNTDYYFMLEADKTIKELYKI